jgi:hypothetical protein
MREEAESHFVLFFIFIELEVSRQRRSLRLRVLAKIPARLSQLQRVTPRISGAESWEHLPSTARCRLHFHDSLLISKMMISGFYSKTFQKFLLQ